MRHRRLTALLAACILSCAGLIAIAGAAPASAAGPSVHFTAAGDFGQTGDTSSVLSGMGAAAPDFGLALGDLSYGSDGGEPAWCSYVRSKIGPSTPFELIAGNHESNGMNGNIDNFAACLPNGLTGLVGTYGKEWYVDVPASAPIMRIIMISPNLQFPSGKWTYSAGSSHYNWTASAIDGARAANIPWVVVGMHEPCLALTTANCSSGADLMNLLVAKKVDLVMAGHVHMYARTKQLAYSPSCQVINPNTSSAACIADSDNSMSQGGTVFATVGTGGEEEQTPNPRDPEAPYFASYSASKAWGFLDVTANSDHLTAEFDRTSGATLNDSFTIGREAGNAEPTAAFTSSCAHLTCSFDASTSSDSGGSIASYAWTLGDGTTATGPNPSHTYSGAGTFPILLTVTDDQGATDTVTHSVAVSSGGGGSGIAFVGAESLTGGAVRSEQVPVPAQAEAGDVLVVIFSGTGTWTDPTGVTGWTSLGSYTTAANTSSAWVTTLGSADLGKSVRMDTTDYHKAVLDVAVYSGVDAADVVATHAADIDKAAHTSPAISVSSGSWVLSYWSDKSAGTTSWTPPSGVATRASAAGTGSGHYSALLADSGGRVSAGTYGPLTATANATSTSAHAWSITLPPASAGGGGGGGGGETFVGASSAAGGAARSEQVSVPGGAEAGDLLIVIFTGTGSWTGPTGVTGLTTLGSFANGTSSTSSVWMKLLTAADLGQPVRMASTDYHKAVLDVAVYSDVDASSVVVEHAADAKQAAHSGAAVTVQAGAWVLSYWSDKSNATTAWTAPAGVIARDTRVGTGSGRYSALLADSGGPVDGGGYGPMTATADASSTSATSWTVVLPAA